MPSPFPGMDPYLEGSLWMTVHAQLSAEIARQLAPKLRPRYLALTSERFVYDDPEDVAVTTGIYPDVSVATSGRAKGFPAPEQPAEAAPFELATVVPVAVPHVTIEIRDTALRLLVCAIEVLSPANKRGGGREEYLAKRRRLLLSTAHLVEIDLLRQGQRVPMTRPLPEAPYFVFVGRVESRPIVQVWPLRLDQRLPAVPIPLLEGDADVPLDIQAAMSQIYDLLSYDLAIDYSRDPEVPLGEGESRWADTLLKAAGVRR